MKGAAYVISLGRGVMKCSKIDGFANTLKSIELFTLHGEIICYVNCILIKFLPKSM